MTPKDINKTLHKLRRIAMTREDAKFLEDLAWQNDFDKRPITTAQEERLNDICNRYLTEG